MKLWEHVCKSIDKYPGQKITDGDIEITFAKVKELALKLSTELKNEKCCAIYCFSELYTVISLLACFAANVTAVPLSPRYGINHCQKILQKISPSCVLTDAGGYIEIYRISDSQFHTPRISPALIMCTSGTKGTPKGVMLSEQNVLSNLRDILAYFKISSKDTILITRPVYHCAVLTGEFLAALTRGVKIVFCSHPFNPLKIHSIIDEQKVTVFCGTPTIFEMLMRTKQSIKNKFLKHIVISGESLSRTTARQIGKYYMGAKIYNVYGLTEASPRISYMPPEYFNQTLDSVGVPLKSVELSIRKQNGLPIKNGEKGTLWVKGPNVMLGYYDDPEQTSNVLQNGWLCTGDIATYDKDGWLKILGRSDDLIIRAGMNIYPAEIESEMKKDKRVSEVIVYSYEDQMLGTQIAMEIVGEFSTVDDVKTLCINVLPQYAIPSKIKLVDKIQKNASGKIIRKANVNG